MQVQGSPRPGVAVWRDLALGGLLGATTAAVAETHGHTLKLALRTVRDAQGAPALALGLVSGFALVLLVLLASRRQVREPALLVLPSVVLGSAILAGGREAAVLAAGAIPSLTMAQRTDMLALAFVRAGGFFALGAIVAAALLSGAAIVVAWRARPAATTRPDPWRLAALAAGSIALPIVAVILASRGKGVGWVGASPSAAGVLAVFVAASGGASQDTRERRDAAAAVVGATLLAVGAVLCMSVARGLVAAVGLGDDGPSEVDWNLVVSQWRGRFATECAATLCFGVPVLMASGVALPSRDGLAALAGAGSAALAASLAVALAIVATFALGGPARALASFGPRDPPAGFTLPPMELEGDCRALAEDSVVSIGAARLWRGATDLGPATLLDDAAGCTAFANAQLPVGTAIWLSADGSTTFARLGCLLGALTGPRAETIHEAQWPRQLWHWYQARPVSPCVLRWTGRALPGPGRTCPSLTLAHSYCYAGRPDPAEPVEPEMIFEVLMTDRDSFRVRRLREASVYDDTAVPRTLQSDARGQPSYPQLADAMAAIHRSYGQHIDPADRKFDFALLRAEAETPIVEVLAALGALSSPQREVRIGDRVEHVPAFDLGVALPAPPRVRPTLEELTAARGPKVAIEKVSHSAAGAGDPAVAEHLGAVRACVARVTHPPGGLQLNFSVDREGFPFDVYVTPLAASPAEPALHLDPSLQACLVHAVEAMPFEPPARPDRYTVVLRLAP